ncbi:MAG: DUF192 domain-containing protein [Limisphaerales bacterium]
MKTFLHPLHMLKATAALTLLLFTACNGDNPAGQGTSVTASPQVAAPVSAATVGQPQAKLPVLKLWVGTNQVSAEIASTLDQIRTGMMFRTNMAEMEGMLFVFPEPQQVAFYMKNTLIPLSGAYIDSEGTILETFEMQPLNETAIPSRSTQVQYVLEMNKGWFDRHNIRPGVAISTERGTFPQTFRRRR